MDDSHYSTAFAAYVCLALVAGMMIAFAVGRHAGLRHRRIDADGARSVSGAVEASIFGLLGLLIAFTFSGAADRFDARRALITDEANAVDAAYRALDLLGATDRDGLRDEFRQYIDARISYYAALPNITAAAPHLERAERLEATIWTHAVDAMPRGLAGCVALLTNSLNRMFDIAETRKMSLLMHPPLPIYALLVFLAIVCASLAGHHASQSARHPWVLPMLFAGISGLAIYVILDLEYPRAGFIRVDSADVLLREVRARMA
jgi:hypothetical protein